ncbi:hypothetical protein [Saccharopolyspora shandongensis]|uniref:hypothetical protein n=1 Tax=Saccharopolyspora shandongensis TaxID=418495 RepID=UPI0033DDFBB3
MTAEGEDNQVQFDATDRAYMRHQMDEGGWIAPVGAFASTTARAADKAAFARSQDAGGMMRVDPDKVDEVARFFEDEAQAMQDRVLDIQQLASVEPPGLDPVSSQAAPVYSQVAAGSGSGYMENYLGLAEVFAQTAANLRASAQQTRTDDQNAADSFRGGNVEA